MLEPLDCHWQIAANLSHYPIAVIAAPQNVATGEGKEPQPHTVIAFGTRLVALVLLCLPTSHDLFHVNTGYCFPEFFQYPVFFLLVFPFGWLNPAPTIV